MRRLCILLALFYSLTALPCTTFVLESGSRVYLGKNLDWHWDQGIVLVNPRNVQKRAIVTSTNAATWTSKYGSVTFNQFGRELPFGGMNEAGLVVESMWLEQTQYPPPDARPEINMLQWIQYQLDNFSRVKQVIASDKTLRLENTKTKARVHYLVCDAEGNVATIEFLNGAMHVHTGRNLKYAALANDSYQQSVAALRADPALGELSRPMPNKKSITRFCRAAARVQAFKPAARPGQDVAYAFDTLDQVSQSNYTAWQMVYDVSNRRIYFRTRDHPKMRHVDLKDLNFDCNRPLQSADINANGSASGAVIFHNLDEAKQLKHLKAFLNQEPVKKTIGDLTWMIKPLTLVLHSYKCAR